LGLYIMPFTVERSAVTAESLSPASRAPSVRIAV